MSDESGGVFADALEAPDFAADEKAALTRSQLQLVQGIASQRKPDVAARALKSMAETGAPYAAALAEAEKPPTWAELANDSPFLARHLIEDEKRAAALSDDVQNLSAFERWLGGWQDTAWAMQDEWQRTGRMVEQGNIGWKQANGTASPEEIARGIELDQEDAANPPLKGLGHVPKYVFAGGSQALAQQVSAFSRHQGKILAAGEVGMLTAGAMASGAGPVAAGAAAAAGFFKGAGVGQAAASMYENGILEGGNFYREAIKLPGVTHESAAAGARFVALANGAIESIEAKVIGLIPGGSAFMGSGARGALLRILQTNTGKMALARFAGRAATVGLMEGVQESMQEFVTIYEGLRSSSQLDKGSLGSMREAIAGKDPLTGEPYSGRIAESFKGGLGMGIFMGGPHVAADTRADYRQVVQAKQRVQFYEALGDLAGGSKTTERLPDEMKAYIRRVQQDNGGVAPEVIKAPSGVLRKLFQDENLSPDFVAKQMPEVARQLQDAGDDVNVEVSIPLPDFAVHIAPLNGYKTLHQDLRVGDGMTLREALAVEKKAADLEAEGEVSAGEPRTPTQQVYDQVRKLSLDLGHS